MIVADLHIHSPHSRATAKAMQPEHLWLSARQKGIDLLGTGDFTHPVWFETLCQRLEPDGEGAYRLRPELARAMEPELPASCRGDVRFLPSAEISSIYKRGGKTRKVHSLILMPTLEDAARLNQRLDKLGNIKSDGRPILGLDAQDLLELCLEVCPDVIFIPAHIWTPWFSVFGSKSGFDSLEECFGELTGHIAALETGLSSDPPMNWRLSALDGLTLVSNSDAHSPAKLAREANLLECPPTFQDLSRALALGREDGWRGTIEFFPDEGKYHLDGHRKCGQRLMPAETRALGGRCPVCGGLITVGVLSRVEDLADRPEGYQPPGAAPFESLVPLDEVVAEVAGRGPATKGVRGAVAALRAKLGPDLHILRDVEVDVLRRAGGELLAEAVRRVRAGDVHPQGGYDGEFGVIKVFGPHERGRLSGQKALLDMGGAPGKGRAKAAPKPRAPKPKPKAALPEDEADDGALNQAQRLAVEHDGPRLVVRAGPGSGKTRVLAARAMALAEGGGELLLITFTRKAAAEMAQRLARLKPDAQAKVSTFHGLGLEIMGDALGGSPQIVDQDRRQEVISAVAKVHGLRPADLELALTRAKQLPGGAAPAGLEAPWAAYHQALDGCLDLDDLVLGAVRALAENTALAERWAGRFGHVLVDEYQDVNPVQVALLEQLAARAGLTAIGDPNQAIYGFRGADAALFNAFERSFGPARHIELRENYRNSPRILQAATALIRAGGGCSEAQAQAPDGPLILAREASDPVAEARWIAAKIVELLGGLDSRQVEAGDGEARMGAADICVLYRLHAQAGPIAEALEQAGVPHQVAARHALAELDPLDLRAQRVSLLSMHAAKGLEFGAVFVAGLERGLLPYEPPNRPPAEEAEERRLLYVALTRAKRRLYISRCRRRSLYGQSLEPGPSPLWADLPGGLIKLERPQGRPRSRQLKLF